MSVGHERRAYRIVVVAAATLVAAVVLLAAASEARAFIYWGNNSGTTIGRANLVLVPGPRGLLPHRVPTPGGQAHRLRR